MAIKTAKVAIAEIKNCMYDGADMIDIGAESTKPEEQSIDAKEQIKKDVREFNKQMPAFKQVLPALFGALGAGYFVKHWKLSFAPILFMLAILVFVPDIGASTLLIPGIIASVVFAFIMYRIGFLDKKEKNAD